MAKDLAIFVEDSPHYQQTLVSADEATALVSGPQKVAQRFVVYLMTMQGSVPHRSFQGTTFAHSVLHGHLATESDVFNHFAIAAAQIQAALVAEEDDDDPDDERFRGASITELELAAGSLTLVIEITTKAGATTTIKLPIQFEF